MRKTMTLMALACTLALLAGPARADDKTLAIVVKGLDNPFFDLIRQGCEKAQAELKGGYKCYYTGPASTSDEAGEVQIIDDLLTKGVAAMAISPSNAPAVANVLRQRKPTIPIMTIDADLLAQDHSLRRTYLGTDNYLMGVKLAEHLKALKPRGGTLCLVLGDGSWQISFVALSSASFPGL
jgi:ribose transport system substrate-binding protein